MDKQTKEQVLKGINETNGLSVKETNRQTGKHTGMQTIRQTNRQTHKHTDKQTNRQTGSLTNKQINRQTYKQTSQNDIVLNILYSSYNEHVERNRNVQSHKK
jgi:hypothetical protein